MDRARVCCGLVPHLQLALRPDLYGRPVIVAAWRETVVCASPEALEAGCCKASKSNHPSLIGVSARRLVSFWVQRLREDPFYLLDTETLNWVQPKVETLGRRFELGDFETIGEASPLPSSEPMPGTNSKGPQ